jgi:type II secretory pathway pseudopilin PulG
VEPTGTRRVKVARGARGAALVEVIVGAVILAIVALAASSATAGGAGLLRRGFVQSLQASVLLRALEAARARQPVPSSIEGFSVAASSAAVVPWADAWVSNWSLNPSCQGACTIPFDALGSLNRVAVSVSGSQREAITVYGVTFTAPQ